MDKKTIINAINPLPIRVEDKILIDSVNNNSWEWQITKTIETLTTMQLTLLQYGKGEGEFRPTDIHVAKVIADLDIQLAILHMLFPLPQIQYFIEQKLKSIKKKNERSNTPRKSGEIGFKKSNDN